MLLNEVSRLVKTWKVWDLERRRHESETARCSVARTQTSRLDTRLNHFELKTEGWILSNEADRAGFTYDHKASYS